MPPSHDPISTLGSSLGKQVIIKCKRHKTFTGVLKSFNTHLNVLLENVS
ncbi:MAG: LSM domain-containing protein, partial [Promethearchaeota archaeon]